MIFTVDEKDPCIVKTSSVAMRGQVFILEEQHVNNKKNTNKILKKRPWLILTDNNYNILHNSYIALALSSSPMKIFDDSSVLYECNFANWRFYSILANQVRIVEYSELNPNNYAFSICDEKIMLEVDYKYAEYCGLSKYISNYDEFEYEYNKKMSILRSKMKSIPDYRTRKTTHNKLTYSLYNHIEDIYDQDEDVATPYEALIEEKSTKIIQPKPPSRKSDEYWKTGECAKILKHSNVVTNNKPNEAQEPWKGFSKYTDSQLKELYEKYKHSSSDSAANDLHITKRTWETYKSKIKKKLCL